MTRLQANPARRAHYDDLDPTYTEADAEDDSIIHEDPPRGHGGRGGDVVGADSYGHGSYGYPHPHSSLSRLAAEIPPMAVQQTMRYGAQGAGMGDSGWARAHGGPTRLDSNKSGVTLTEEELHVLQGPDPDSHDSAEAMIYRLRASISTQWERLNRAQRDLVVVAHALRTVALNQPELMRSVYIDPRRVLDITQHIPEHLPVPGASPTTHPPSASHASTSMPLHFQRDASADMLTSGGLPTWGMMTSFAVPTPMAGGAPTPLPPPQPGYSASGQQFGGQWGAQAAAPLAGIESGLSNVQLGWTTGHAAPVYSMSDAGMYGHPHASSSDGASAPQARGRVPPAASFSGASSAPHRPAEHRPEERMADGMQLSRDGARPQRKRSFDDLAAAHPQAGRVDTSQPLYAMYPGAATHAGGGMMMESEADAFKRARSAGPPADMSRAAMSGAQFGPGPDLHMRSDERAYAPLPIGRTPGGGITLMDAASSAPSHYGGYQQQPRSSGDSTMMYNSSAGYGTSLFASSAPRTYHDDDFARAANLPVMQAQQNLHITPVGSGTHIPHAGMSGQPQLQYQQTFSHPDEVHAYLRHMNDAAASSAGGAPAQASQGMLTGPHFDSMTSMISPSMLASVFRNPGSAPMPSEGIAPRAPPTTSAGVGSVQSSTVHDGSLSQAPHSDTASSSRSDSMRRTRAFPSADPSAVGADVSGDNSWQKHGPPPLLTDPAAFMSMARWMSEQPAPVPAPLPGVISTAGMPSSGLQTPGTSSGGIATTPGGAVVL